MKDGFIENKDYKTYYQIYGEITENSIPLIILHGGPGGNLYTYEPLTKLSEYGTPVILYNQHGSGESSIINKVDSLYTIETFEDELDSLLTKLNVKSCHLLGHSWGGMLALHYAINKNTKKIKSLILFSALPSSRLWNEESLRMVNYIPTKSKEALMHFYNKEEYNQSCYKRGVKQFCKQHQRDKKRVSYVFGKKSPYKLNKDAYNLMWGDSELFCNGTLLDFDVVNNLKEIKLPTLILSGQEDESTPYMNKIMNDNINGSKWILYRNSQHVAYLQETEKVIKDLLSWFKELK